MSVGRRTALSALAMAAWPAASFAEGAFPTKPVTIIVPYPAGGGADAFARALGQQLSVRWKQPVVVDNRPGAATQIGAVAVARAAADGYTLLLTSDTTLTINPAIYKKLQYDPVHDFTAIGLLVQLNQMLLVRKEAGFTDLASLIARAKSKPGKLSYASYGSGSEPHLAMETLKSTAGIDVLHVPYKGVPAALNAVLAGEVDLTFSGAASGLPHLQSGKLQALAIGGDRRLPLIPDVPTFAEVGQPAVPAEAWFALLAPTGTASDRVQHISGDVRQIGSSASFLGNEVIGRGFQPLFSTADEMSRRQERERPLAAARVKLAGAVAD